VLLNVTVTDIVSPGATVDLLTVMFVMLMFGFGIETVSVTHGIYVTSRKLPSSQRTLRQPPERRRLELRFQPLCLRLKPLSRRLI
jgi:hypothetical protein